MSLPIRRSRAVALPAGILGVFVLSVLALACFPAGAQQLPGSPRIFLGHRSASAMSAADRAQLRAHRAALAEQAVFFGYDLSLPGWRFSQAFCSDMPDYLLLHYRRTSRNGAQSLFTALVPRDSGRVLVVPVLYRNATPFRSAVGSQGSFSVFNRAVPPSVAEKALQPGADWLQLALCYAEIVGAEPRVPRNTDQHPALAHAPAPTLHISEIESASSVSFTDRNAPHSYTVWNVTFDSHGRVAAASAASLPDYVAHVVNGKEPTETPLPPMTEPKVVPLPPQAQPKTTPIPQ